MTNESSLSFIPALSTILSSTVLSVTDETHVLASSDQYDVPDPSRKS